MDWLTMRPECRISYCELEHWKLLHISSLSHISTELVYTYILWNILMLFNNIYKISFFTPNIFFGPSSMVFFTRNYRIKCQLTDLRYKSTFCYCSKWPKSKIQADDNDKETTENPCHIYKHVYINDTIHHLL